MCAISGIIEFGGDVDAMMLRKMSDQQILRGPDESGIYIDHQVGLAHRRLSVIDVNSGQQPMSIANGTCTIVYNGEIYNFLEIKHELIELGIEFCTDSDTEVVLCAYQQWGIETCLDKMEGMFAFAIYDKTKQKVFLARDRFGEKPLYYMQQGQQFVFASELKALQTVCGKRPIDKTALNLFLSLSYIPAPYTIYQGIRKMMPGHFFEIDLRTLEFVDHKYYDVLQEKMQLISDRDFAIKKIRDLVSDSIHKRMVSDVPIGAFLSGGIDSSIVCCMMSKFSEVPIKTFSIGFKEKEYDESERAKIVADHIHSDHTQFTLDYSDVINILDDIILYYDEPFGDSSAIPSYYVAKLANNDVKVVLTGDCADELFGGYEKYLADYYVNKYRKVPKLIRYLFELCVKYCPVTPITNRILRKVKKVVRNSKCSGFDLYYNMLCQGVDDASRKKLLKPESFENIKDLYHRAWEELPSDCSFLQKEQLMDVKGVLEGDMFPKVERACMHNSLENRSPFIDKRVLSYAINLCDELKINGKSKKYILKEAFKGVLPEEILKFPKSGFEVPVDYWFMHELKDDLKSLLGKDLIDRQNIFDYEYVSSVLDKHLSRKENFKGQLWNLFVFQKWYTKIYERS